jgi:hypothetical protein
MLVFGNFHSQTGAKSQAPSTSVKQGLWLENELNEGPLLVLGLMDQVITDTDYQFPANSKL